MASVNSRGELFPNRAYSPTGSDEMKMDDDPEFQRKMPLRPRHQSDHENSNVQVFTGDDTHQYEDPGGLKTEVFRSLNRPVPERGKSSNRRPRKKVNEVYEQAQAKQRRGTFADESESSHGYQKDRCPSIFKILAFAACLFAVATLAVAVLVMLGILSAPTCQDCKKEVVAGSAQVSSSTRESVRQLIKELRANLSELTIEVTRKDEIISQLLKQDLKHTDKIAELERKASYRVFVSKTSEFNISVPTGARGLPGIPGPPGPKGEGGLDGKPGKPGLGNMSLCVYRSRESVLFTADASDNGYNVVVAEPEGYRIVYVTCSSRGASEYNFKNELNSQNVRQFECECRGKSHVFAAGSGSALCIIHYWMCPLD